MSLAETGEAPAHDDLDPAWSPARREAHIVAQRIIARLLEVLTDASDHDRVINLATIEEVLAHHMRWPLEDALRERARADIAERDRDLALALVESVVSERRMLLAEIRRAAEIIVGLERAHGVVQ